MAGNSEPLSPRAKLAVTAGKAAAAVSRAAGRGSGSVIGGRVALKLDPDLLARLAQHLDVVLVSATNGKTTTTRLIAEALRASGPGRLQRPRRQHARRHHLGTGRRLGRAVRVIEVDEKYLSGVARERTPKCIALLNLSRDQLDRAAETRMLAEHWREGLAGSKAVDHRQRRRPARRLGRVVLPERGVGGRRPGVEGRRLVLPVLRRCDAAPRRRLVLRRVRLPPSHAELGALRRRRPRPARFGLADPPPAPGRANKANAATSAAVAAVFGVPPQVALERMHAVQAVAGRYDVVHFQGA